jgi:hypothetical protein
LNETDHLLATYKKVNVPMELNVITDKGGINMLRPGVSPYLERIQKLIQDDVSFFARERSIAKVHKREGVGSSLCQVWKRIDRRGNWTLNSWRKAWFTKSVRLSCWSG